MSPNISGVVRAKATIETVTDAEVFNLDITTINTEFSHTFTPKTKAFSLRARSQALLKIAFNATESGTKFFTVQRGTSFFKDDLDFNATIYIQSPQLTLVEIIEWR